MSRLITCSKRYDNLPFAHRQPNHAGHCRLIHGHNWSFEFEFVGPPDKCGFVVDFGDLKWLRQWLEQRFDHTLVLNDSDPDLFHLEQCLGGDIAKIVTVPNCGAEGLARYLFDAVNIELMARFDNRVGVLSVTVREDDRNSAKYAQLISHSNL